jgi:hypothetical protein
VRTAWQDLLTKRHYRPSYNGKVKPILLVRCRTANDGLKGLKSGKPPCYTRTIMIRLLTTLLVWLLMAMLPLHALAASVNLSCAPVPHDMGSSSADEHAAHATADGHARHDEHASHAGHAVSGVDMAATADAGSTDVPHSSCSACSVFCVGAVAPPSALLPLPSIDGSESVVIAPSDFATGFIPDGPQRPPRH